MNYATIKKRDIANGSGVRVSLFVSGCTHHCDGCFNPETWDFDYGSLYTEDTERELLDAAAPDFIRGLSLLGGEPLEPANQAALLPLVRRFRELYPEKTVWCYSGYDYEKDILSGRLGPWETTQEMLSCLDVLVDGEFHLEEKDLTLRFRGSRNQRVIDIQKSLAADRIVWWEDEFGIR